MIIFRYLAKEVLLVMAAVSAALLLIIMSSRFVKYLAQAASGDLASDVLFAIMLYRIPGFLELILPLALFLGILLAYGRLYVESEMVVLSACGFSPNRLLRFTLLTCGAVTLLVALISLWLSPSGAAKVQDIFNDPKTYGQINTLVPGRFQSDDDDLRVSYAETLTKGRAEMRNVFMSQRAEQDGQSKLVVLVAARGKIVREGSDRYLELYDGHRYEGAPGDLDFRVMQFAEYGQLLREPQDEVRRRLKVEAKSTADLFDSDDAKDRAALQWRFSLPLLVPIVSIIALALSRTDHRRGRFVKLLPAIVIYLVYLLSLSAARSMVEEQQIPVGIGIWWVHALFLVGAIVLLYADDMARKLRPVAGVHNE